MTHHLYILHTNPWTNSHSPVLLIIPMVHSIYPPTLARLFLTVSPLSRGWWGVGNRQKTDPCHCHSDLILGPFPRPSHICRSGMASMDQRKWLVGFEPVTPWTGLLPSIAPLSPPPSNFTLLSGSGVLKRDAIISPHQSVVSSLFRCQWQTPKYAYNYIWLSWFQIYCNFILHLWSLQDISTPLWGLT